MPTLSVIIITRDEAANIRRCLQSVQFADEIIVLDSGSQDETVAICREFTEQVFDTDWPGYGPQKNRALAKTQSDWVLSIDADEYIPAALAAEIQATLATTTHAAFRIPLTTHYCGKAIRFGDWRNDRVLRLFRRERGQFTEATVHEKVVVDGTIGQLKNRMQHYSFPNLQTVIDTMNEYSSVGADMKFNQGKTASLRKAIVRGVWTFLRGYIFKLGFLDGKAGFMLAVSNAEGCYYRYAKLALRAQPPI